MKASSVPRGLAVALVIVASQMAIVGSADARARRAAPADTTYPPYQGQVADGAGAPAGPIHSEPESPFWHLGF